MRYSWLIGAICAAGALAKPLDKRSYVTEWTIITITTTITLGAQPTPTPTNAPIEAIQLTQTVSPVDPVPAPVESEPSSAPPAAVTPAVPVGSVEELPAVDSTWSSAWSSSWDSAWTSAWTSSWTSEAPQPTTLEPSAPTAPGPSPTNAYQSTILYSHNIHRSNHSASSLTWNSTLESNAYALASQCVYRHNTEIGGGGYGQNIGYGISSDVIGVMISNMMYNDEFGYYNGLYGQANPDMTYFEKWGHFSQILWKGSVSVGCATVVCPTLGNVGSNSPFTVCNYYPPGNYAGEYGDNVLAPLGHPYYSA